MIFITDKKHSVLFIHSEKNIMPKYKIKNEQILSEFLDKFWKAVGRKKGAGFIKKLMKNDPELRKLTQQADDITDKFVAKLQGRDTPDYDELEKFWNKY